MGLVYRFRFFFKLTLSEPFCCKIVKNAAIIMIIAKKEIPKTKVRMADVFPLSAPSNQKKSDYEYLRKSMYRFWETVLADITHGSHCHPTIDILDWAIAMVRQTARKMLRSDSWDEALCSRFYQNVKLDFTWNQFWQFWSLKNSNFYNFISIGFWIGGILHFFKPEFLPILKSWPSKTIQMDVFRDLNFTKIDFT